MSGPALSVVVAWQQGSPEACLRSLLAQRGLPPGTLEILLVPAAEVDPTFGVPAGVRCLEASAAASLPRLFGAGVAAASGELVAVTEAHCTFPPEWAARVLDVQRETAADVLGGAVEPAPGLGRADLALFFCDYAAFLPPLAAGPSTDLPGNNVVFRRAALPPPKSLQRRGLWKTFHCRHLARAGARLHRDPRLEVLYHRRSTLLAILRRRWIHGRCFGAMRGLEASPGWRLLWGFGGPALPLLLTWRTLRQVARAGRLRGGALTWVPLCFLLHTVWVAGEEIGNGWGAGRACDAL